MAGTVTDVMTEADARMAKAVDALRKELGSIRTGRASPALVERIAVDYHGTPMPLNQLASITVPEARLLQIQPWDQSAVAAIEKAILKSELGLTPTNDGRVIRLAIPPLTQERRRDLTKVVRRKVEEGRVAVRNVRRDAIEHLKALEKQKEISEDEFKRSQENLQKVTDRFIADIERVGEHKEAEIMEV